MPKSSQKTPYRCSFCRERLSALPLEGADYLRAVFLIRPFQCPHCFNCVDRPFAWIGRLPLVGRLVQGSLFARASTKSGKLPPREGDLAGPVTKAVAKFGRWVTKCEQRIGGAFTSVAKKIWAVIWFIPGLFFKKRKRRSSNRFLKSRR